MAFRHICPIRQGLIAPTMAKPGVKYIVPYRSPTDPLSFLVYELCIDEAGWDAHNSSLHFLSVVDELVFLAAHRERVPFVPLDQGTMQIWRRAAESPFASGFPVFGIAACIGDFI